MMTFLWPGLLAALALVPLLVVFYGWVLRRRQRYAIRYSSLSLLREILPKQPAYRRHLPFALFLIALSSLVFAAARPMVTMQIPSGKATIILALDVSRSMCALDIPPNRLEAAKDAAQSFVERHSANTQIGVVAFAGYAELIQPPTSDETLLRKAIDGLTTGRRTGIGNAIARSLEAITETGSQDLPNTGGGITPTPFPEGSYAPDIIVLLTDGSSNTGIWPVEAAQMAAERGIRVYTIGFGTTDSKEMDCFDGFWNSAFLNSTGMDRNWFNHSIDERTLVEVAAMTGGEYYSAQSSGELQDVFRRLPTHLSTREEKTEASVIFTAAGAFLALLAASLSLLWKPLP